MKRTFLILLFLTCLMLPASLSYGEEKLKVTTVFDKRTVGLNGEIKFTIRIVGGKGNILRPRVPHTDQFDSYYTGRSSQFTFVNGRSESTTTFSYTLLPKRVGKFMLPPIEVEVDNQIFRTDPIEIEVIGSQQASGSGAVRPTPAAAIGPGQAFLPSSSGGAPLAKPGSQVVAQIPPQSIQKPVSPTINSESDRDIFLNVFTDKVEAYPNEQILLIHSVFTRLSARSEQFEKDPDLSGFWVEEIPIPRDYQAEKIIFEGLQYMKADVRRLALFPTATGTFEIDPGVFRITVKKENRSSNLFDDFFDESFFSGSFFSQREQKLLTARPLKIVVRPLPEQGKPADFSGMVGQFRMSSTVDKRAVKQNEPILFSIVIEGEGNIEMLERPPIPDLKDVKIYDSDSSTDLSKSMAGVRGRKSFEVTLIPTAAGEFEIPSLSFSFFDPRRGKYQTLKTSPYQIRVSPGPAVPLPDTAQDLRSGKGETKKKITRESSDIHFIKENFDLQRKRLSLGGLAKFLLMIDGLFSIICMVLFGIRKHEERLDQNLALKRSSYAARKAQKGIHLLKKLSASARSEDMRKFFQEAPKILNQYFADKFNLSSQGMTLYDIERRLEEKGLDVSSLEALRSFYEVCDRIRFSSAEIPQIRAEELLRVIQNMMDFMEKQ